MQATKRARIKPHQRESPSWRNVRGHPYAEHTGQNWVSKTHIDCVGRHFDVWFDDEQVMARGKFLL